MAAEISSIEIKAPLESFNSTSENVIDVSVHISDDTNGHQDTADAKAVSKLNEKNTLQPSDDAGIPQELNESQKAFLESCEQEFANRYTSDDVDYKTVEEKGIGNPPIVVP